MKKPWWPNLPDKWERVFHVSQKAYSVPDPATGAVTIKWKGETYVKPKDSVPVQGRGRRRRENNYRASSK